MEPATFSVQNQEVGAQFQKTSKKNGEYVFAYNTGEEPELGSGTVTIEEYTGDYVKGTFEFELIPEDAFGELDTDKPNLLITNGQFNIKIE